MLALATDQRLLLLGATSSWAQAGAPAQRVDPMPDNRPNAGPVAARADCLVAVTEC
jgi:hypothetical protein